VRNFRIYALLAGLLIGFSSVANAVVLKIATIAPEGSEWMQEHRSAAAAIKTQTDGRVILKFYGGGVMGNDKKVLRKIRIGQLQGGAFSATGIAEKYPDIVLYGMPFIFRSQAEVDFVRENLDDELMAGLEKQGFISFGFAGGGFANLMGRTSVGSHAALKGKKIWVPEGDVISYTALESQNLSPVVLPLSDVMTALQTGLLDVISTPPSAALLLQWHTKLKYVNPVPVAYTLGLLALVKSAMARLTPADQDIVTKVLTATYKRLDEINRSDNEEAMTALLSNGIQITEADADSLALWRSTAEVINKRIWSETAQDKSLFERTNSLLGEFRSRSASAGAASAGPDM
jgi:TRAP-type C4-dicarboxylate transport system substrate-binding protein